MTDKINAEDVFKAEDFESIRLIIRFKNFTTNTEVKDYTKNSLIEVGEKSLVLEVPEKSCNAKHNVMVKVSRQKKKLEEELLNATGKVAEIENVGEGFLKIKVEFVQVDDESWTNFLSMYSNRQDEIENFLKAARGY